MVEGAHVHERRRANFHPVGTGAAVADDEEAQFALRGFGRAVGFGLWRLDALRVNDEMMDQAFHVPHDQLLGRRDILRRLGHDRSGRQLIETLRDDPGALPHLFHADPVPVVRVAVLADRHFPIDFVVDPVGLGFADIVGDARPAQDRPGAAEVDRVLRREHGHVLRAAEPDAVRGDERIVFLDLLGEGVEEGFHPLDQFGGEVAVDAADAIVVQGQPGAAELLEHVQEDLSFPEGPEEHGHRADIEGLGAEPEEVPDDALHLRHDGADIFGPDRHGDIEELFHGPHIGIVVGHGADIVEPVRMGDDLHVGQALGQFLDAPMQVAEVRRGLDDPFAVQLQHDPQDAVGAGMLRSHVQEQFFFSPGAGQAWFGAKDALLLFGDFAFGHVEQGIVHSRDEVEFAAPASSFGREVFSQGIAFGIVFRH